MNLLFVHDHKFRKINNRFYSTGGLNDEVLTRYTNLFDKVTVYSRVIEESSVGEKYSLITNEKVNIINSNTCSKKELKKLVQSHNKVIVRLPCFNGLKVLPLCRRYNKNYLIELVACPWDSLWNYDWRGKLIAPFIYVFNKYHVRVSPNVLYVTDLFLQKRYPNTNNTTACSDVVLESSDDIILKNRLDKIKNLKTQNVINIGTLAAVDVKYKGQYRVIKAISSLRKKGISNYCYHLAGNGNINYLKKTAKKYKVEDCVFFYGGIPHEKVKDWFKNIDIYIQPSLQEGLPRALVEAMNNALPCIGARTGGIPELLNKNNIFSNYNPVSELEKILIQFDEERMRKEAVENFSKAKDFGNEVLKNKRNQFYEDFKNQPDFIKK